MLANNNKTYQKAATPNPMSLNSQNHYLIQSLQSESKHNQQLKENQPIQTAPQDPQQTVQRFYTESPITNQDNTQPAIPSNSDKKNAKARKSIVPKNPNTPKRRKTTICSKEKVNQIPLNSQPSGSQSEYLSDGMAIATNSLPTGWLNLNFRKISMDRPGGYPLFFRHITSEICIREKRKSIFCFFIIKKKFLCLHQT